MRLGDDQVFVYLFNVFSNVCVLHFPECSDILFTLHTNASLLGVGVVLNLSQAGKNFSWAILTGS